MERPSSSSDAASILSGSTVFSKEAQISVSTPDSPTKTEADTPTCDGSKHRKSMRQRVRNVVADLGRPPTTRDDLKSGSATQKHVDVGPASGTVLMGSATVWGAKRVGLEFRFVQRMILGYDTSTLFDIS